MSINHMAINFTLKHKAVTSSIIGARTVAQLDDSLDALEAPKITGSLFKAIDKIAPMTKQKAAEG